MGDGRDQAAVEPSGAPSTRSFRSCVRADLTSSTWAQRALLLATVGWVAYEWGFGNETLTPWILVRVVSETSGATSVVAATAVAFGFTVVQQTVSGYTALYGFSMFERTASAARARLMIRLGREPQAWHQQTIWTRALVVFTLGTTAVVLIESTTTGAVGSHRQRAVVAQAAVLCGSMVAAIAAVGASAVLVGRSVESLQKPTDWFLRVLSNPLLWIGLLVGVLVTGALRRRIASGKG